MSLIAFLVEAALISLSGVMAPGPISAVAVARGADSPHAGVWVAVGHGLVEMPLIVAIGFGLGFFFELAYVKEGLAIVGGIVLLWMAVGMFRSLKSAEMVTVGGQRSPLAAGAVLSASNPYFLLWWATVGAALILRATRYGAIGLLALAVTHWLCDLGWDYFLSALSYKGGRVFGQRFQQVVLCVSGVFLLFFGARFLFDGARSLLI